MTTRKRGAPTKAGARGPQSARPRCGLCRKATKLTRTPCCGQWICDDADRYVLFSYARNSCSRNHDRYTLCGFHFNEGHPGVWQECPSCRESFETELYVHYGTNEYNFEKLVNPPAYEPTRCARCRTVIDLGEGGYSVKGDEYLCAACTQREFGTPFSRTP
jgi:hypothetical protein